MVKLEHFKSKDLEYLSKWIDNEKDLFQFAGDMFSFPITETQIVKYLNDSNRFVFKVVYYETIIGQAEIYLEDKFNARLCRILIGDSKFRGKGIGDILINELLRMSFEELKVDRVNLNVFDWNIGAIKCYEKSGMKINKGITKEAKLGEEKWIAINMSINKNEWKK
ncbi:GNAT family N-acetyltransferase [Lutibacter flavus]|uniref:Protein N-acetyltransferase, RimJ/RimL family n=1 Tax=Lutibacter flavus TaxID=691689 RepID=A0A238VYU0_9FLAO|nr:GNAT family protein [Lutibacter flavus]SNR39515.1 Protein N-acetyltransferase, RimJ/RimL family [Lutibacter flavus]